MKKNQILKHIAFQQVLSIVYLLPIDKRHNKDIQVLFIRQQSKSHEYLHSQGH